MTIQREGQSEYDVFICCADAPGAEMATSLVRHLRRHGFLLAGGERAAAGAPDRARLALVEAATDFLLLLTPATVEAVAEEGQAVCAEVERALATGRNVVIVSPAGAPRLQAQALPPALSSLAGRPPLVYDPDRLAESLSIIRHVLASDATVNERRLMRRTKRLFIGVGVFVLAAASLQVVPALIKAWNRPKPLPPVAPFALYWSGFGQRVAAGGYVGFDLVEGVTLSGGDHITVAFSPSADGHAYVVVKDMRGRVSALFPTDAFRGGSRVRAGRTYRAPVESGWLTVDSEVGIETIYVFGSYDPLQNLEELVEESETPQNAAERAALVDQTVKGLIDGRHYQFGRQPWIRTMQLVDQSLKPGQGPAAFSVSFPGGTAETRPATVQPGLVSALAEIKVRFTGPGAGDDRR